MALIKGVMRGGLENDDLGVSAVSSGSFRVVGRMLAVDPALDDVEAIAAARPDTFRIPSREMRVRLVPGDLVKLHFRNVESGRVERMWVETSVVTSGGYLGKLDNDPTGEMGIIAGEEAAFLPEHVASVWCDAGHDWPERMTRPPHPFDERLA